MHTCCFENNFITLGMHAHNQSGGTPGLKMKVGPSSETIAITNVAITICIIEIFLQYRCVKHFIAVTLLHYIRSVKNHGNKSKVCLHL